jgi:hypothetical protein
MEDEYGAGRDITSTPTVVSGTVYLGSDNVVYTVDGATGEQQWTFETESAVRSSPTVRNGTVYFGTRDGTLYAVTAPRDGGLVADGERLSILSTAQRGEGEFSSRIVVDGDAVRITEGANSADDREDFVASEDGRTVITGSTGSGAGDAFRVTGELLSVTITWSDEYRLELAGEDVTDAVSG